MNELISKNLKSRVGTHCWGTSDDSIALLAPAANAGARWVRATRQMQWDTMTTGDPHGYDFAKAGEASIDLALAEGMSIMGILDARWGNETLHNDLPFASPVWEHLDLWKDWVSATVAHYRDRVKFWEVINEPPFFWWYPTPEGVDIPEANPDLKRAPIRCYVQLLQATAEAVRAADPEAKIVVGSGFCDAAFLEKIYKLGGGDYFDIASVHYIPCHHPDKFAQAMRRLRSVMAKYGDTNKEIWDTENGPSGAVIGVEVGSPEDYEGLYNFYRHCFAYEFGLDRYFWFNPPTPEGGRAMPYRSLEVLHDLVGEGTLTRSRHFDGEAHGYVFAGPEGPVTILWATAPATVHAPVAFEGVTYIGEPVTVRGEYALTGKPVCLYGDILDRIDIEVTGKRATITLALKHALEETAPHATAVRLPAAADFREPSAWSAIPLLSRADEPLPGEADHFVKVSTTLPADAQVSFDDDHLYVRAHLVDKDGELSKGSCVLLTIKDRNPAITEWPFYTSGYCLISLFASNRGPIVMRYESFDIEGLPTGRIESAKMDAVGGDDECTITASIPWSEIGPLRPGAFNPFFLMMTYIRADQSLEVPAGDEPEEWSHNFADAFIVKTPPVVTWLDFA